MGINCVATNLLRRPKSLITVSAARVPAGSLRGALTQASPQRLEGLEVLGAWACRPHSNLPPLSHMAVLPL